MKVEGVEVNREVS